MESTNNINYKALWKSFLVAIRTFVTAAVLAVALLGLILLGYFHTLICGVLLLTLCFVALMYINYQCTKK